MVRFVKRLVMLRDWSNENLLFGLTVGSFGSVGGCAIQKDAKGVVVKLNGPVLAKGSPVNLMIDELVRKRT